MSRVILLNKPFGVMSQFTSDAQQRTLAECGLPAGVYAAGRLDADSEGLLLLTDDGVLQHQLADPRHKQAVELAKQPGNTVEGWPEIWVSPVDRCIVGFGQPRSMEPGR